MARNPNIWPLLEIGVLLSLTTINSQPLLAQTLRWDGQLWMTVVHDCGGWNRRKSPPPSRTHIPRSMSAFLPHPPFTEMQFACWRAEELWLDLSVQNLWATLATLSSQLNKDSLKVFYAASKVPATESHQLTPGKWEQVTAHLYRPLMVHTTSWGPRVLLP